MAEPTGSARRLGSMDPERGMAEMETAVVFESMYGATHEVVDAIAEGVAEAQPAATVTRAGSVTPTRPGGQRRTC